MEFEAELTNLINPVSIPEMLNSSSDSHPLKMSIIFSPSMVWVEFHLQAKRHFIQDSESSQHQKCYLDFILTQCLHQLN